MSSAVHASVAGGVAWPASPSRAEWERRLLIAAAMAFVGAFLVLPLAFVLASVEYEIGLVGCTFDRTISLPLR